MKKQIKRLSAHQNGKVFGMLMAVSTFPFILIMFFFMQLASPQVDLSGNPIEFPKFILLVFPFMYLLFGYLSVGFGCIVYNFTQKYIGGFEYETSDVHSD